jgi:hypothetical protein
VLNGYNVSFKAFNQDDVDVTGQVTFEVDGAGITANIFTPANTGQYQAVARTGSISSTAMTIESMEAPTVKRGLIENYTGSWCPWCPRVSKGIENVQNQTSDILSVFYHTGGSDPMTFPQTSTLANEFAIGGYPTGILNRKDVWTGNEATNMSQPMAMLNGNLMAGVSIDARRDGQVVTADIKVGYNTSISGTKLVAIILEDGVNYPQRNATSYYGGADPINPYTHNSVTRKFMTDLFGDTITGDTTEGAVYTTTLTAPASNVVDMNNLRVVAMVVNRDGEVLNINQVDVGSSVGFD